MLRRICLPALLGLALLATAEVGDAAEVNHAREATTQNRRETTQRVEADRAAREDRRAEWRGRRDDVFRPVSEIGKAQRKMQTLARELADLEVQYIAAEGAKRIDLGRRYNARYNEYQTRWDALNASHATIAAGLQLLDATHKGWEQHSHQRYLFHNPQDEPLPQRRTERALGPSTLPPFDQGANPPRRSWDEVGRPGLELFERARRDAGGPVVEGVDPAYLRVEEAERPFDQIANGILDAHRNGDEAALGYGHQRMAAQQQREAQAHQSLADAVDRMYQTHMAWWARSRNAFLTTTHPVSLGGQPDAPPPAQQYGAAVVAPPAAAQYGSAFSGLE